MKSKTRHVVTLTLLQLLLAVSLQAQQLKLGELELIYTEDEIPIRYDGSLSTIRKDGEMHFFHSFGCRLETSQARRSRHSWHKGPPDDPLKCHVGSKTDKTLWDYNGYYQDQLEKGIWILSMYQCPNGDLLAITHAELNEAPKETRQRRVHQRFALGLGYCTALGKYLLTVQTHGAGKLVLFSSPDGLDWSRETIVDQVSNGAIQPYSSFVDFDGPSADCHTVDDDFFIYFPRKGPDHDHDYLFRRKINIEDSKQ